MSDKIEFEARLTFEAHRGCGSVIGWAVEEDAMSAIDWATLACFVVVAVALALFALTLRQERER